MSDTATKNFFVSYTGADSGWAQWIAWVLEDAGFTVVIQAWDFQPGANFVAAIHDALQNCDRVVLVLSPKYLESSWCQAEWTSALVPIVNGKKANFLAFRVVECEPPGLLAPIGYVDLTNGDEATHRDRILKAAHNLRGKPSVAPPHPPTAQRALQLSAQVARRHPSVLPPIWNVTLQPNPFLRGRDKVLSELHAALNKIHVAAISQPQVAHGLGGIGKTQLAVEYAHRYHTDFDAVLWVGVGTPATADSNLARLTEPGVLSLTERAEREQGVQVQAVLRWLREHSNWLLVLDNADSDEAKAWVEQFLRSHAWRGRILVTSRRTDWTRQVGVHRVDVLSQADSIALLQDQLGPLADPVGTEAVAEILDGLPLALEQAAAYALERQINLTEYNKRLKARGAEILATPVEGFTEYPRALALTWQVTIETLPLPAQALLRLCAFLAPDPIPRFLFEGQADLLHEAAQALAAERDQVAPTTVTDPEDALMELKKHALVTVSQDSFTVHRLVQRVQELQIPTADRTKWLKRTLDLVNVAAVGDPQEFHTWTAWMPLEPHILDLVGRADLAGVTDPTVRLMNEIANFLSQRAFYVRAEPLYRRVLAIREGANGVNHHELAPALNGLGLLCRLTNRNEEAEALLSRALAIDELEFGKNHPNVASVLNNLASVYLNSGRMDLAEKCRLRVLQIFERAYGDQHSKVAIALVNLASVLQRSERYLEAKQLIRRALAIHENLLGPDHPNVAYDLHNLAAAMAALGETLEAIPVLQRAARIFELAYGQRDPRFGGALFGLAKLHEAIGYLGQAQEEILAAIEIFCEFRLRSGHQHEKMIEAQGVYRHLLTALGRTPKEIEAEITRAATPNP